jgi:hypothetical protein
MTNRRTTKAKARKRSWTRRHPLALPGAIAGAIAVAVVAVVVVSTGGDEGMDLAVSPTGEVSEMGLPVVVTPGEATGIASAAGIEVTGARWRMGQVPLNVTVRPSWTLVNTSDRTVSLGQPHPEIRAGCCPGAFVFGRTVLAPGESTSLSFELAMHPGMDGWHDFAIHVPVAPEGGAEGILDLVVTADFRGMPEL